MNYCYLQSCCMCFRTDLSNWQKCKVKYPCLAHQYLIPHQRKHKDSCGYLSCQHWNRCQTPFPRPTAYNTQWPTSRPAKGYKTRPSHSLSDSQSPDYWLHTPGFNHHYISTHKTLIHCNVSAQLCYSSDIPSLWSMFLFLVFSVSLLFVIFFFTSDILFVNCVNVCLSLAMIKLSVF